jgi:hypothetical protein
MPIIVAATHAILAIGDWIDFKIFLIKKQQNTIIIKKYYNNSRL